MYRLKSPLSAQLELTFACNCACRHCYNFWRYRETGTRISSDPMVRSLEHFEKLLGHLIENEVRTVTFTGGEPFIRRDILFDLVATAKKAGMKTGINTNGALITPADISRLQLLGVDFMLVSLLSDDPAVHNWIANSDTHSQTSRTISALVEADIPTAANMVVSSHNWNRVRQTTLYARKLGVGEISATPVLPCPLAASHTDLLLSPEQVKTVLDDLLWARDEESMMVDVLEPLAHCMFTTDELSRFVQFLSHRSCSAGISDMVISPDGDVRPCILATESCGNLLKDGWEKCWGNMESWCSPDLLPDECLDCDVVDSCGGGCRVAALATSGTISGKDPYMTHALVNAAEIDQTDEILPELNDNVPLTFPLNASIRDEEFGCVVFLGRSFMFLDADGASIVHHLQKRGSFTPLSITQDLPISRPDLIGFLALMMSRGFILSQG